MTPLHLQILIHHTVGCAPFPDPTGSTSVYHEFCADLVRDDLLAFRKQNSEDGISDMQPTQRGWAFLEFLCNTQLLEAFRAAFELPEET